MEKLLLDDVIQDYIDEQIVVIKPGFPFLEWLKQTDKDNETLTLDELHEESSAFLIPDFDDRDEVITFLKKSYKQVFATLLYDWYTDPEMWPKEVNFDLFLEWFEIEWCSTVHQ